jgi:hypothetical protein
MLGELPQFYMFPRSHGNISFLQNKRNKEMKRELFPSNVERFSLFCENRQFRFLGAGSENCLGSFFLFFKVSPFCEQPQFSEFF